MCRRSSAVFASPAREPRIHTRIVFNEPVTIHLLGRPVAIICYARDLSKGGLSFIAQERLAEICDLHRSEISLLERSGRSPRLETIWTLTQGLGLSSPCELLECRAR